MSTTIMSVIISCLLFVTNSVISWMVYERTRRIVYLRIFLINNLFAFLAGLLVFIMALIKASQL